MGKSKEQTLAMKAARQRKASYVVADMGDYSYESSRRERRFDEYESYKYSEYDSSNHQVESAADGIEVERREVPKPVKKVVSSAVRVERERPILRK